MRMEAIRIMKFVSKADNYPELVAVRSSVQVAILIFLRKSSAFVGPRTVLYTP